MIKVSCIKDSQQEKECYIKKIFSGVGYIQYSYCVHIFEADIKCKNSDKIITKKGEINEVMPMREAMVQSNHECIMKKIKENRAK